ncbi:MAG: hypothetical protein AMXMBFR59_35900 [Rhodanobacteraceae bacterium]
MHSAASDTDIDFWRRVRDLFLELSTLPASARDGRLREIDPTDAQRAAVQRLLALHDDVTRTAATIAPQAVIDALAAAFHRAAGETDSVVADFHIERLLGEGGMGRVYLATREVGDTTQRVALKIVPSLSHGRRIVEQLRRERRILAGLDHPSIARLIDAGELPDGRPYFAMEFVDGVPVTRYCDNAGLDLRARMRLFLDICDAVAYAHRRLVLHRDLKDSNILVDADGRPRLLDFGIAKSLDDAESRETTQGQNYFSLRAAAPEQIRGKATTVATDVYGLGCLLYELLSGQLPFDLSTDAGNDLLRRILEQPPPLASAAAATSDDAAATRRGQPTASALAAALRGDLDMIIARALRKDPAERYRSVDDLAADIQNVLALRPIAARASEGWYRFRMLLRRHRLTAAVAGVLGVAVIATTTLSIAQSLRASAERDRAITALESARLQRDHAQQVTDFLVSAFQGTDRVYGLTRDLSANELLDNAAATLQRNSAQLAPALRATLAQTLAHLFYLLRRTPEAVRQAELARSELRQLTDPSRELQVRQFLVDAEIANLQNRYADAIAAATHGIDLAGDAAAYVDGKALHMLWEVKLSSMRTSNANRDMVETARRAMNQLSLRSDHRPEHFDWMRQQMALGLYMIGESETSRAEIQMLIADQRAGGRENSTVFIESLRLLGQSHSINGEYALALPIYEEAIERHLSLYGEEHRATPSLLGGLAGVYVDLNRELEGIQLFLRAIAVSERVYGRVHPVTANMHFYAAELYFYGFRDLAQAERLLHKALRALPSESVGHASMYHRRLGELLLLQDKLFEAAYYSTLASNALHSIYGRGQTVDNAAINSAFVAWRRYEFPVAEHRLTGSLLDRVRRNGPGSAGYHAEPLAEAELLSEFFGWNRESDGSTIVAPMSR